MPRRPRPRIKQAPRRVDSATREAIAKAIAQAHLSQVNIAHLYDVSLSTVARMKRLLHKPITKHLQVVAEVSPWRCPECGFRIVTATCVACNATKSKQTKPR